MDGRTDEDGPAVPLDRRTVMKGAAAGGVAALGLTATSGTAAAGELDCATVATSIAPDDFPVVVADDNDLLGSGSISFTEEGTIPEGEDEVLIFVHGWLASSWAAGQAHALQEELRANGYDHPVMAYKYASNNPIWWMQTGNAEAQGRAFASWIADYRAANPNTTIRLVGHSLGARTTLGCLDELVNVNGDDPVASLTLLGGAVAQNAVTTDGEFGQAVANGANQVNNYHSKHDGIVDHVFELGEAGTEGVGAYGAPENSSVPSNYADHDVSSKVDGHCNYFLADGGCVGDVVTNFDTAPGTTSSSGGGSGSGGNWLTDLFGW